MSGETLEDYFKHLKLDETRRKYLENIKEGKRLEQCKAVSTKCNRKCV
jgi:hypothetical protein